MDPKQACVDLEKATQFILQVLQKDESAQHTDMIIYTQARMDLEKATQFIIQVLQHEVEKGVVIARSLTEQVEANKQLKLKIDKLQKQLEEKDNLLTQAGQGAPPSFDTKSPLVSSEAQMLEVQVSRIKKEDESYDAETELMQGAPVSADSQMRLRASGSGMKEEQEQDYDVNDEQYEEERGDHRHTQAAVSSAADTETESIEVPPLLSLPSNGTCTGKRKKYDVRFKLSAISFAEQHSTEAAARVFSVDPKRVRDWRKNKAGLQRLSAEDGERSRLRGGGRRKISRELEVKMCEWLKGTRAKGLQVSRRLIRMKAREIYATVKDARDADNFVASRGWLNSFLKRNAFSAKRRMTTVAEKNDAWHVTEKLVVFVTLTARMIERLKVQTVNVLAVDRTAVCLDKVVCSAAATAGSRRARGVPLRPADSENNQFTVVLAAKADGTKLEPCVVFKGGGVEEVREMQDVSGLVVASSKDGRMNDELTADWLRKVMGKLDDNSTVAPPPRLLAWDSCRCYISTATIEELQRCYNVTTAIIPEECAKYIPAPGVTWCKLLKHSLQESYEKWMAEDAVTEDTTRGSVRVPSRRLQVAWVLTAWDKLDTEIVKNSFKECGLSVSADGSEDHLIRCFREGEPYASGRELLAQVRRGEVSAAAAEVGGDDRLVVKDDSSEEDED